MSTKTNTMPLCSGHIWNHGDGEGDTCLRCGDKDWMADEFCSKRTKALGPWEKYCPICRKILTASNMEEVENLEHDGYLFKHDELPHTENDIDALRNMIS
jgi:hypothetical protein